MKVKEPKAGDIMVLQVYPDGFDDLWFYKVERRTPKGAYLRRLYTRQLDNHRGIPEDREPRYAERLCRLVDGIWPYDDYKCKVSRASYARLWNGEPLPYGSLWGQP